MAWQNPGGTAGSSMGSWGPSGNSNYQQWNWNPGVTGTMGLHYRPTQQGGGGQSSAPMGFGQSQGGLGQSPGMGGYQPPQPANGGSSFGMGGFGGSAGSPMNFANMMSQFAGMFGGLGGGYGQPRPGGYGQPQQQAAPQQMPSMSGAGYSGFVPPRPSNPYMAAQAAGFPQAFGWGGPASMTQAVNGQPINPRPSPYRPRPNTWEGQQAGLRSAGGMASAASPFDVPGASPGLNQKPMNQPQQSPTQLVLPPVTVSQPEQQAQSSSGQNFLSSSMPTLGFMAQQQPVQRPAGQPLQGSKPTYDTSGYSVDRLNAFNPNYQAPYQQRPAIPYHNNPTATISSSWRPDVLAANPHLNWKPGWNTAPGANTPAPPQYGANPYVL